MTSFKEKYKSIAAFFTAKFSGQEVGMDDKVVTTTHEQFAALEANLSALEEQLEQANFDLDAKKTAEQALTAKVAGLETELANMTAKKDSWKAKAKEYGGLPGAMGAPHKQTPEEIAAQQKALGKNTIINPEAAHNKLAAKLGIKIVEK